MRAPKIRDAEYVKNLTEQIIGKKILLSLTEGAKDAHDIFLIAGPTIEGKLKKMGGKKLGELCMYGLADDVVSSGTPKFIRRTPLSSVLEKPLPIASQTARQLLEKIVQAVIISVAIDIIRQPLYQKEKEN